MSRVQGLVKSAIEAREMEPAVDAQMKKVTIRLNVIGYYRLQKVAEAMGFSPTGCAQELMMEAIEDAWEAAGLVEDHEDVVEFLDRHESESHQRLVQERFAKELEAQQLVEGQVA